MNFDVYVVLTGRTGSGKDTFAKIGVEKYGCAGYAALSDWFKKVLSDEFKLSIETFYSDLKERPFKSPIMVSRRNLRNLKKAWADHGGLSMGADRIATSQWVGRQLSSPREMMQWFAQDVVNKTVGPEFHCKVLEETYFKTAPRSNEINLFFITDARNYKQSKYFKDKYPDVYTVKLVGSTDSEGSVHSSELDVERFPKNYFDAVIKNDGSLEDFEKEIGGFLESVMSDLKRKYKKK